MSQSKWILLALVAGLLAGIGFEALNAGLAMQTIVVTQLIGSAWLHGLQMVIIPLVVGLLVTGIAAGAEAARAGKIALWSVIMFVAILWTVTLMSALVMPVLLQLWPLPAAWSEALRAALPNAQPVGEVPTLISFFEKLIPSNVIAAAANGEFLPLTVFGLIFAFAVTQLPAKPRGTLIELFQAIVDVMLVIIHWVLRLAPIGVFALAYGVGVQTGGAAFGALLHYIVIVSSIGFIVLLAAYPLGSIGGRVSILRFARAVAPAQAVAISTQSSLASMPAMLESAEELGAPPASAGITLPIAVAIFRATSPAMNLAVAIYVAHLLGISIGPAQLAFGVCVAAITTMGSVSLPGTVSFIASVAPVAAAMGLPLEALGLLVAVETIPDIFRTVGNVTADTAVAVTVARRNGAVVVPESA
jgi:proton glutamate symport protein